MTDPAVVVPNRTDRAAALILGAGIVAVMLAALAFKVFELDRYFVPKELVMNVAALLAATLFLVRGNYRQPDMIDALLIAFIAWSIISGIFAANHWAAQRAIALSLSSAVIFWTARSASEAGLQRVLLVAASSSTVIVALTSLAQAYGVETEYFTLARAPGGTLGNRNFIAHIVAIGLPVTLWCTLTARRAISALIGSISIAVLAATLVLSRSRAAWLATVALVVICAIPFLVSHKYWNQSPVGGRFARLLLAAFLGGTVAVIIPNTLEWNSDSPYLDSARKVVDYSSGSGRGRIAQYRNSLKIVKADPLLGAGPGNWPVKYPKYAPGGDKSLAESGMTANPWPSSDWVAFVSERGAVATVCLLAVFATMFFASLRRWRELAGPDAVLLRIALAGTIVTTMVVSAFDAVLLLPAPAFLAWLIFGASVPARTSPVNLPGIKGREKTVAIVLTVLLAIGVMRSASQIIAMTSVGTGGKTAGWVNGARFDPGSYRIQQRVAELYANRGQCAKARPFIRRAVSLFPSSPPARRLARRCR